MLAMLKAVIRNIPIVGPALVTANRLMRKFDSSQSYWESRYSAGGNSGCGSYGDLAKFKADFLNNFVAKHNIRSVVEIGCGDGNQLTLAHYPKYLGLDVAKSAIDRCKELFANDSSKRFMVLGDAIENEDQLKAELALSLDVIYHLIEDSVYEDYMNRLFRVGGKYVIIYSSNFDDAQEFHVKHRKFSDWVKNNCPSSNLILCEKNKYPYQGSNETGSLADFYVYQNSPR